MKFVMVHNLYISKMWYKVKQKYSYMPAGVYPPLADTSTNYLNRYPTSEAFPSSNFSYIYIKFIFEILLSQLFFHILIFPVRPAVTFHHFAILFQHVIKFDIRLFYSLFYFISILFTEISFLKTANYSFILNKNPLLMTSSLQIHWFLF